MAMGMAMTMGSDLIPIAIAIVIPIVFSVCTRSYWASC